MNCSLSLRRSQSAVVSLPVAIGGRFRLKRLECGESGLKGDDSAAKPVSAKGFAELANVCADVHHNVDLEVLDEIDQIPYAAPSNLHDSEALIKCSEPPIHESAPLIRTKYARFQPFGHP